MHGKCDLCANLTVHRVPVSIDGAPVKTLDLCGLHHKKLLGPVLDAIAQYGMPPRKVVKGEPVNHRQNWKRQIGPFKCKVCPSPPLKSAATLETHLRLIHEITLEEYVEEHGLVTATQEELDEPVTYECTEKGCDQVYSTQYGHRWPHTAMITHMRSTHALNWRPGRGVIERIG
jgi:hypothetical protein